MNIDFIGETSSVPNDCLELNKKLMKHTLKKEHIKNEVEITVSFVTNEEIQQLNKQYRNKNEPTDVLSFPLFTREELRKLDEAVPISLGDIVISVETAQEQSIEYNHSLTREVCFLAIHGLLHLLGYDHLTEEDEKIMFAKQHALLEEFGIER